MNPKVVACLDFAANVDLRSGIVADQNYRERGGAALRTKGLNSRPQFILDLSADFAPIQNDRVHVP